ncbi:MAG: hypothetical protein Q7S13_04415, partial [Candidatus Omnitrophota bacterium]|nr:hypothetical protein [Candidatus Omnitrophota bacterium]
MDAFDLEIIPDRDAAKFTKLSDVASYIKGKLPPADAAMLAKRPPLVNEALVKLLKIINDQKDITPEKRAEAGIKIREFARDYNRLYSHGLQKQSAALRAYLEEFLPLNQPGEVQKSSDLIMADTIMRFIQSMTEAADILLPDNRPISTNTIAINKVSRAEDGKALKISMKINRNSVSPRTIPLGLSQEEQAIFGKISLDDQDLGERLIHGKVIADSLRSSVNIKSGHPAQELISRIFRRALPVDMQWRVANFLGLVGTRVRVNKGAASPESTRADAAQLAAVDPKLLADFPDLFQERIINGRRLDPLNVITALAEVAGSDIPKALNARRLLLESTAPVREKYAFPKWDEEFEDASGKKMTFRQIVQGMIDNFLGVDSEFAWRMNDEVPVPDDIFPLSRPGLQITGPSDPLDMAIKQLNGDLSVRMPDLEDASAAWYVPAGAPQGQKIGAFAGIQNESELLAGEWEGKTFSKGGKQYRLTRPKNQRPTTIQRVPSIHLKDKHITINGKAVPAIDVAIALHALNTHEALKQNGSGNYYYQPKIQTPGEALIAEKKVRKLEEIMGLPLGTIKIEMLYEEGNAGRQLPVIMWVLRHRLIGSNVGRWDYIGSLIEMHKDEGVFPDPQTINMNTPNLVAYQKLNALLNLMVGIKNGKQTNAAPIGGMAAVMLYPPTDRYGRSKNNPKAIRAMKIDKLRERLLGLIFVADEPLAEGQQASLEDILSGNVKGRLYDTYRQSWVATPDSDYVAAGNSALRSDIKELQALLDAPEEWIMDGDKKVAPTTSSGLIKAERDLFASPAVRVLSNDGKIMPRVISKDKFSKPEDLFNDQLWDDLYAIPKGEITIEHVQHAFYMSAQYGFQILNGNYAAAIDDYELGLRFMNDLATYRIFVGWLWTVFHHKAQVTKDGWIKDPELVADRGVVPNKNVIEIKSGTELTPGIFDQVWDAHGNWTQAFFAEQDRLGAASAFDRKWADVIMEVLKKQLLSPRYVQHSPRILFVIAEATPELRKRILETL